MLHSVCGLKSDARLVGEKGSLPRQSRAGSVPRGPPRCQGLPASGCGSDFLRLHFRSYLPQDMVRMWDSHSLL